MVHDKNGGLTTSQLATKVLPAVLPFTAYPTLQFEHLNFLFGAIHEMIDIIER